MLTARDAAITAAFDAQPRSYAIISGDSAHAIITQIGQYRTAKEHRPTFRIALGTRPDGAMIEGSHIKYVFITGCDVPKTESGHGNWIIRGISAEAGETWSFSGTYNPDSGRGDLTMFAEHPVAEN